MTVQHSTKAQIAVQKPARGAVPTDLAIYQGIADAIFEQRLSPGTKLTEDVLGEIFGVSRTVVRKALFRLAHERVIEIRPNRGAVVASPSIDEARHVFEARRVVEAAIVGAVCRVATPEAAARLHRLVAEEHQAHTRDDRRGWIRLSGAFHLELAELAGNTVLADFLRALISRTSLIIALYETPGKSACVSDDHRALLDSIARGNEGEAIALMIRHLERCEAQLNLDGNDRQVSLREVFSDLIRARAGA